MLHKMLYLMPLLSRLIDPRNITRKFVIYRIFDTVAYGFSIRNHFKTYLIFPNHLRSEHYNYFPKQSSNIPCFFGPENGSCSVCEPLLYGTTYGRPHA